MRPSVSRLLLFLLALAVAASSPAAAAAGRDAGTGLGKAPVEALVELRHPRGLNSFVRAVSDPISPRYRHYASVEQLVARFGADKRDRKQVLAWLHRRGLRGVVSPTATYVAVRLSRSRANRLLPRLAGAAASAVGSGRRVPPALSPAVRRISLASTKPLVTTYAKRQPYRSVFPHTGTANGCPAGSSGGVAPRFEPFTPNQYLTAYGFSKLHAQGLRGQGQTAAVVELGGFRHSDVVKFGSCFGIKPPPIHAVPVGLEKALAPEDETTLDLEMLSVGAPQLDRILVYESRQSLDGLALTAGAALGRRGSQPDVISMSLGFCEQMLAGNLVLRNAFDNVFATAAGAGISVLVSAGDQGSSGCWTTEPDGEKTAFPLPAVSMPASSPFATAVGGTNLELSKKNRIKEEVVWNDSVVAPLGGGGGASILSPRTPWWQRGVHGYGLGRKVPDLSALADRFPGYAFFCTAKPCVEGEEKVFGWGSVGGTSASAPLTAAGIALADQYAERHGQPPLGFLNPLLYRLGAAAKTREGVFNDVVKGNNDIGRALPPEAGGGHQLGCCSAKPGYDWASGWGSLKLDAFAHAALRAAR
jgi:subtilase family serine protease